MVEKTMTEEEWLSATDPESMLEFIRYKTTTRKLRLFACACPQLWWNRRGEIAREIIAIGERYADNTASQEEVEYARWLAGQVEYRALGLAVIEDIARAILPAFSHEYNLWVEH